ncbi:hypothetical protein SEVIR_4G200100v4 [Setaria viridis]
MPPRPFVAGRPGNPRTATVTPLRSLASAGHAARAAAPVAPGRPAPRRLRLRPVHPPARAPPPPLLLHLAAGALPTPSQLAPVATDTDSSDGSAASRPVAAATDADSSFSTAATDADYTFSTAAAVSLSTTARDPGERRQGGWSRNRAVRRVRRGVGAGRGGAAAVRAGDVPLRGRGVLLRGERPAGRRVHTVALGAAPLQPPQVRRFNATDFLARLRGKRLMLVGDSMNRNQFESLLCILREALPDKTRMFETHGYRISKGRGYFVFKFADYDCTVEFVRSHFLVREGVRFNRQRNSNPILQIDRVDKTANRWKKADVLVFNTGHWWTHGKTARGKNYYKEGDTLYPHFDSAEAYRRALKTWARWIDKNMDPARSVVFYRGYSTAHFR